MKTYNNYILESNIVSIRKEILDGIYNIIVIETKKPLKFTGNKKYKISVIKKDEK